MGMVIRSTSTQVWLFRALLLAQVTVVLIHMVMVTGGYINPWKWGGYAMYTVPGGTPTVEVFQRFDEGASALTATLELEGYRVAHQYFHYYCQPQRAAGIATLLRDNPSLQGMDIDLVIAVATFDRYPLRQSLRELSRVTVRWSDATHYTFNSTTCGRLGTSGYGSV